MPTRLNRLGTREHAGAALLVALFTAAPFAGYVERNRDEIAHVSAVLRTGLLAEVLALAGLATTLLVARRARPASAGAAVASVVFLTFQWSWFIHGPLAVQYALWLTATLVVAWAAARIARSANGRLFLVLLGAGLVAAPAVSYLSWRGSPEAAGGASGAATAPASASAPAADDATTTGPAGTPAQDAAPNVYFFVLDGYGRADQLETVVGHDDSAFLAMLEERGFDVRSDAFSSYPATFLSISSMLEMDFVATEPSDLNGGHSKFDPLLQGDSAAVSAFHSRGYAYVHGESGTYDGTRCGRPEVDYCIPAADDSDGVSLDELQVSLLRLTPVRPLLDAGALPLGDLYTDPERVSTRLAALRTDIDRPVFLFAHVVSPHAPYRRHSDCSHLAHNVGAIGAGWKLGMRHNYVDALQCVQHQTITAVDSILRDDPGAIIVLTGDHGTAFNVSFNRPLDSWTPSQIAERFAVFHATRLPEQCRTDAPEAADIVNSLRVVVACVDDRPPDLLRPRSFLYRYGEHEVVEIDDLSPMQQR